MKYTTIPIEGSTISADILDRIELDEACGQSLGEARRQIGRKGLRRTGRNDDRKVESSGNRGLEGKRIIHNCPWVEHSHET